MSGTDGIVTLPTDDPKRLSAAIEAVVRADGDKAAQLRAGAEQTVAHAGSDVATARRFQTMLELGYLAASADGFADEERASLALLLENITGAAVDHDALQLHFHDLDEAVASLGRRERLARVAADLDDDAAAEEAIGLAALISMADGRLTTLELEVLEELGRHVSLPNDRVRTVVDQMAQRVQAQLQ